MTEGQRSVYLFLLMCGRETEATQYRDKCETEKELSSVLDDQDRCYTI